MNCKKRKTMAEVIRSQSIDLKEIKERLIKIEELIKDLEYSQKLRRSVKL